MFTAMQAAFSRQKFDDQDLRLQRLSPGFKPMLHAPNQEYLFGMYLVLRPGLIRMVRTTAYG